MSIKFIKGAVFALCAAITLPAATAMAQDARTLDELLGFVKQGQTSEAKDNRAREQRFANAKADQARLLKDAEAERTRQERKSGQLEDAFEANDLLVTA